MNKTLEWVKAHELPSGGIEAWHGCGRAYPEVTGYLLPTLLKFGETELSIRLAEWLCSVQQKDGGWMGLDGIEHTFDTAAIYEGLQQVYFTTHGVKFIAAIRKAKQFLEGMYLSGHQLRKDKDDRYSALYTARANWVLNDRRGCETWLNDDWYEGKHKAQRAHYIAYALEGFQGMGMDIDEHLRNFTHIVNSEGMMPFTVFKGYKGAQDSDTTATMQFALLYHRASFIEQGRQLYQVVRDKVLQPSGGLWHDINDHREISWAAKYYLDYVYEAGE